MNELIPVRYEGEEPTVSGRELHAALEIETRYNDWFPRMCEYGFLEGKDFCPILSKSSGGRPGMDHAITIQMAKELCMLQRTAKGKQCRAYFINCEEAWNSPDKIMERALQIAHRRAPKIGERLARARHQRQQPVAQRVVAKAQGIFELPRQIEHCGGNGQARALGARLAVHLGFHAVGGRNTAG